MLHLPLLLPRRSQQEYVCPASDELGDQVCCTKLRMFKLKNKKTFPIGLLDCYQKAVAHEFPQQLQQRRGCLDSTARLVAQQMQAWGLLTCRRQQIEALALRVDLKCQAGIVHLHHLLHAARHDCLF